jgi:hypothetical protein
LFCFLIKITIDKKIRIRMDLREMRYGDVDWVGLAQDRNR